MSVSSIGGGNASQLMASLLSRIQNTNDASQATSTTATASDSTAAAPDNQLTGSTTASLSDQVLGVLVMMQNQGATQGSNPVSQAFSSLDTDGDGSLSQSELESAIETVGGTAGQADSVYAGLGGTDSTGISQDSFASAVQAGGPPPGGPGGPGGAHHHHHHHAGQASQDASQIFTALDSNQDGSVSADELTTALGSTDSSGASSTFSAIDANGDGAVSQDELKSYMDSLQQQSANDQANLGALMNLANQSYSSRSASTAATTSVTA